MKYTEAVEEIKTRMIERIDTLRKDKVTSMERDCFIHNINMIGINFPNANAYYRAMDDAIEALPTNYKAFLY